MPRKTPNYSKLILTIIMFIFCGVAIWGVYLVQSFSNSSAEYCASMFGALLTFVAAPTAVAIGFYAWKAKAENAIKLAKDMKEADIDAEVQKEVLDKND